MKRILASTALIYITAISFGCSNYIKLQGDQYLVTESTQDPVMWGVSNSHSLAIQCKGTQREGYNYEKLDFSECKQVTELKHSSAPGYRHAVVNAFLNALTFGLLAGFLSGGGDGGNASASSSSSSNASAASSASSIVNIKGGHK